MYFLMKAYFSLSFQNIGNRFGDILLCPWMQYFLSNWVPKEICFLFCFQCLYIESILLCHSCEKKGIFFHLASARWMWNILKIKATEQIVKKLKVYDKLSAYCLLKLSAYCLFRAGSYWKYSTSISFLSKLLLVFAKYPIAIYTLQNRTFRKNFFSI